MNELGIAKLRGVVRRRKVPIIAAMIGVIGVAAAVISQVEPGYKASAVIRAADVQPAKEYVAPTVAELMGERLKSLRLAVMARPIVAEAAKQVGVFKHYPRRSPEEVVEAMRARMDVKVEGDDTFLLTYEDGDPERAKNVVNAVAELFMKRQVEQRRQIATATTQALRDEVQALRPQLDEAERKVREFKIAHYGALPEQQEINLRQLDQATMEINIQSTNLDYQNERRRQILAASMSPLRRHEETLAAALYEARTRYTADHPEVLKIQTQYETVKTQRIAEERDLSSKLRRANPELLALEGEIARTRSILAGLRDRQASVRRRVEATAKNAQALAVLQTEHEALKDKYTTAISHLRDAELAERLEGGLASMRFDLVEGASLPGAASSNRALMAAAALALALGIGLGLGFALDAADTTLRDPEQLRAYAPTTPILASIPRTHFKDNTVPRAEA